MIDAIAPPSAQYLRDDAIRGGMDLLLFAHKSHLRHADDALAALGLGRAHHRALYFISRRPDGTVSQLLDTLGITKQSAGRVIKDLARKGLIEQRIGEHDRRTRLLRLTGAGVELEHRLFEDLHDNMARAYAASGEQAVRGYWTMMQHLMNQDAHRQFVSFSEAAAAATT